MRGYCSGSQGAVLRHASPAPCSILRGTRCAAWRTTPSTLASSSVDSRTRRSPPLLLPAPEAATFSTAAGSPDSLGRLRHLAARLPSQHASKGEINALVKEEEAAAASHREQLAELRQRAGAGSKECKDCGKELELCLFPADKHSPDGHHHLCFPCRAKAKRMNRPAGKNAPTPRVSAKLCSSCGELREAEWFHADSRTSTGLQSRCMPCFEMYNEQRHEKIRREGTSQEPAAEKKCRTCEKTLPISSFYSNANKLDGFMNICLDCNNNARAAWRMELKERFAGQPPVPPAGEERICSACGTAKPWSEFHKDSNSTYGIRTECKQCLRKNVNRRYAKTRSASKS